MLHEPFRGSAALAAGLVTRGVLRGPRFRRLFPDVYVPAELEADLALRSRAAHLLVSGRGAVSGWSAAELLGASCGSADAPAEVITWRRRRSRPGLRIRHERLPPDELVDLGGITATSALRTAFDLGRRAPLVDGVVAMDALARVHRVTPDGLRELVCRYPGARGGRQLAEVLRLANPLAESPMETRIRVAIVAAGLPVPALQHPVGPYRLDLAYPAIRLAIEYDGREHLTPERALRDLDRQAYLTAAGWTTVLRFRTKEVYRPGVVADRVRAELARCARRYDRTLDELLTLLATRP